MSYESPITLIQDRVQFYMDEQILKAVQNVGIDVDKSELLRALKYDRNQYQKGYEDGKAINQWIPVSERLPDNPYDVLITTNAQKGATVGWYSQEEQRWRKGFNFIFEDKWKVIAWMPLPESYKEDEEQQ